MRNLHANSLPMRALKILLIIGVSVLALLVILFLMGPAVTTVERTVAMLAPDSVIYPRIASLRAMHEWSPWAEMDRDQHTEFHGADGTIGSKQTWAGDTVGTGSMEVTELVPFRHVGLGLRFIEPFASQSKVDLDLETAGDTTHVTQRMTTENGFLSRIMCLFMDMDAMIGPMFERGLNNLRERAEADHAATRADIAARTINGHLIHIVERPAQVYVGRRGKRVKWTDLDRFHRESLAAAAAALEAGGMTPGVPAGVYFLWNEQDRSADMLAGFAVDARPEVSVPGMDVVVVPASQMLHVVFTGDHAASGEAHVALDQYIADNQLTHYGNVVEEYVVSPVHEPDTAKWVTHIYYQVR